MAFAIKSDVPFGKGTTTASRNHLEQCGCRAQKLIDQGFSEAPLGIKKTSELCSAYCKANIQF